MNKPVFSIIIPVYRVEAYLHSCLESIVKQTYTNFEVILVDDGSPDKCPEICDMFCSTEPRCKVIHQKNKGLSGARNAGMNIARGKYIYFLDSDDTIEEKLLETLYGIFTKYNADIVGFNAEVVECGEKNIISTGKFSGELENGLEILKKRVPLSTVPLYCFKKSFLEKTHLIFKEGILYEDVLFTAQIFLENPKLYFLDEIFYLYNKREASITTSKVKIKNYNDIVNICDILLEDVKNKKICCKTSYRRLMLSYLMLSEEVYRMLDYKDKKTENNSRKMLMNKIQQEKKELGLINYLIAKFPNFFYFLRETRRKIIK